MRNRVIIVALSLCALLAASCHRHEDRVMAQVYYHKLYESEILQNMPTGLSPADSIAMVNDFIDKWVKEQLILHEAEKNLSPIEKNFDKQIDQYRNNLLVNAYFDKLVAQSDTFNVTDEELEAFMKSFDKRYTIEKEIVKVNYVKLLKNSPLLEVVKGILFDDARRAEEKESLAVLLGDSIEYLLDDDTWLYLDDIQNEVSFDFTQEAVSGKTKYVEKEIGDYHYLLVVLDYKNQRSVSETNEEKAAARMMLLNQKRQRYLKQHVDELYQKALKSGSVTQ